MMCLMLFVICMMCLVDLIADKWADERKLKQFILHPNPFQHIGRYSGVILMCF